MAPKKQQPRNAYFFFMLDYQQKTPGYHKLPMKKISELAGPLWNKMSKQQRAPYEKQAAAERNRAEKLTSLGTPINEQLRRERQTEESKRGIELEIEDLATSLKQDPQHKLAEHFFYFVHFNCLTRPDEQRTVPAELGLSEFSLRTGVNRTYNCLINIRDIPMGFTMNAREISAKHKIPLPESSNPNAEYDARELAFKIRRFILGLEPDDYNYDEHEEGLPALYTRKDEIDVIKDCLFALMQVGGIDGEVYNRLLHFKVYPIEELFFQLHQACTDVSGNARIPAKSLIYTEMEKDKYSQSYRSACMFHEEVDCVPHCSLSKVRRWGYTIADFCCKELGIELEDNKHCPPNAKRTHLAESHASFDVCPQSGGLENRGRGAPKKGDWGDWTPKNPGPTSGWRSQDNKPNGFKSGNSSSLSSGGPPYQGWREQKPGGSRHLPGHGWGYGPSPRLPSEYWASGAPPAGRGRGGPAPLLPYSRDGRVSSRIPSGQGSYSRQASSRELSSVPPLTHLGLGRGHVQNGEECRQVGARSGRREHLEEGELHSDSGGSNEAWDTGNDNSEVRSPNRPFDQELANDFEELQEAEIGVVKEEPPESDVEKVRDRENRGERSHNKRKERSNDENYSRQRDKRRRSSSPQHENNSPNSSRLGRPIKREAEDHTRSRSREGSGDHESPGRNNNRDASEQGGELVRVKQERSPSPGVPNLSLVKREREDSPPPPAVQGHPPAEETLVRIKAEPGTQPSEIPWVPPVQIKTEPLDELDVPSAPVPPVPQSAQVKQETSPGKNKPDSYRLIPLDISDVSGP